MLNTSLITNNTRELIVQLSRENGDSARALAKHVEADLNTILTSDPDAANLQHQAQQTMYAIEEVLTLLAKSDFRGAREAARDAAKEWRASTPEEK